MCAVARDTRYLGISLGTIGGSLEIRITGTDLPNDVMPVHVTILLQHGGDIDRPMCSSSSMKTTSQAHYGESSSVQDDESHSRTYPGLLDKLRVPQPSDLG